MSNWEIELCSEIRSTKIDWLWPRYLARGKLAILDGDPEMGKSLLTIDLMARLSRGGTLPDGAPIPRPCTSILLSAEDNANDTVRPRAEAAGADLTRIVVPNFGERIPRLPVDIPALEELIRACDAEFLVIDPLMAFLPPTVAASIDQCVRQVLSPLAVLAGRTGCAILLVRHLVKKQQARALVRGQGSIGIIAAVRTGLFVAPHPDDPTLRVLASTKSNVGRRPTALGYRVIESETGEPAIEWTGPVQLSADGLCQKKIDTMVKACDRAIDWLKRALAEGPRKSADLYAEAAAAGIPERTLERAKSELPARSHRLWDDKANQGEWYWYDPDAKWPKKAPFRKPFEMPPLNLPYGDV
jgi:hypothetical protein